MDWLERFFGDKAILAVLAFSGVIGLVGGLANGIIQKKHGTWGDFFACIFIGLIVSIIIGLGIKDHIESEAFRFAVVGVSAVISQDIWAGFRAIGRLVSQDPLGALARLIAALRGQSLPPSSPPPTNFEKGTIDGRTLVSDLGPEDKKFYSGTISATEGAAPPSPFRPMPPPDTLE